MLTSLDRQKGITDMLKKEYLKTKVGCKVTFTLPETIQAETANLVGDFNNWNSDGAPMSKLKNGRFAITLDLEKGREYQFRYLVNSSEWHNDWDADNYVSNPFSGENSVVAT
jgi:1,4-alpha-glucan branching enzyme